MFKRYFIVVIYRKIFSYILYSCLVHLKRLEFIYRP